MVLAVARNTVLWCAPPLGPCPANYPGSFSVGELLREGIGALPQGGQPEQHRGGRLPHEHKGTIERCGEIKCQPTKRLGTPRGIERFSEM